MCEPVFSQLVLEGNREMKEVTGKGRERVIGKGQRERTATKQVTTHL